MTENKDKKRPSSNDDFEDQRVPYRVVIKELKQKKEKKAKIRSLLKKR